MKYFNKRFHKGFTLAELMVCLALISIIATLMMPAISKLKPNKNKIMFKKAYSIAERTVSELIDDADLYPTGDEYQGFDNTTEVYSSAAAQKLGEASPTSSIPVKGLTCSGNGKFACLFANQLDLGNSNFGLAKDYNYSGSLDGNPSFYTSDGVAWVLPITDFKPTSDYMAIYVDVNGKENGPNCYDNDYTAAEIRTQSKIADGTSSGSEPTYSSNTTKCEQPDRFKIYVRADGKMKVEGAAAKAYLGTTNLTGNKEKGSAD